MSISLPSRPSYEQLRKQAKDLHKALAAGDPAAALRLRDHHPDFGRGDPASARLADAQLVMARQLGFGSWPRLKRAVGEIEAVEAEVAQLRGDYAAADEAGRQRLLEPVHDMRRLPDHAMGAAELSDADARVVVANRRGYALWSKYDSFVYLDPAVKAVIAAARVGDLPGVRAALQEAPEAVNPRWVAGYEPRESDEQPGIPNDSVPLFCACEGVFAGTNRKGNEGSIARALLEAGADPDLADRPMEGAVSFDCPRVLEALIEHGADLEGPAPGVWMSFPMLFGFTEVCQLLAAAGARLDLRFAAGLGRLDEMERWLGADGRLRPDPGLADAFMQHPARRGQRAVRVERTDDVVLGQALLYACLHGRREAAQWLVDHGADVNAPVRGTDVDGTVLHRMTGFHGGRAAAVAQVEAARMPMVGWLLDRGADPTVRDAVHGADAIGWAMHSGMERMGQILRSRAAGATRATP